jgi:uridylate kinase
MPDTEIIKKFSELVLDLHRRGNNIAVVIGGGRLARNYINSLKTFKPPRDFLDWIGIKATRLNAMAIIASLGKYADQKIPTTLEEVRKALKSKKIVVLGGIKPRQTTDKVSADVAGVMKADLLVIATDVKGVYDKDPKIHRNAKILKRLSFSQLKKITLMTEFSPGKSSVVDPPAAKVMEKNEIKTLVLDGRDMKNLKNALEGKKFIGTVIEK